MSFARSESTPKTETTRPDWMTDLRQIQLSDRHTDGRAPSSRLGLPPNSYRYVINVSESQHHGNIDLSLMTQQLRIDGRMGPLKELKIHSDTLREMKDPVHEPLMKLLLELPLPANQAPFSYFYRPPVSGFRISSMTEPGLLPRLAETGQLSWRLTSQRTGTDIRPLSLDTAGVWRPVIEVVKNEELGAWVISGHLVQQPAASSGPNADILQVRPFSDLVLVTKGGHLVFTDLLGRLDAPGMEGWVELLQRRPDVQIAFAEQSSFLAELTRSPRLLGIPLPPEFCGQQYDVPCRPRIRFLSPSSLPAHLRQSIMTFACVDFLYGNREISAFATERAVLHDNSLLYRNLDAEMMHRRTLAEAGCQALAGYETGELNAATKFPQTITARVAWTLLEAGWLVEAENGIVRRPGSFKMGVTSGLDWFDLNAQLDYGGMSVTLPELLRALRSGHQFIQLSDGTQGMLPEHWLKQCSTLISMGEFEGDALRFRSSQAMLLDALLESQSDVQRDTGFVAHCQRLKTFRGIRPKKPTASFQGELRDYQKQGLSWLHFLNEFQLGGCLADDMGLGKTVQVLALLEARRARRRKKSEPRRPSLVVVPKSLIFNWQNEAARFAPKLKVVNQTGTSRHDNELEDADVILTTYGTLRNDIVTLEKMHFDYIILDEAQAIKNPDSLSAKVCRLLKADHRLAMTGTPVENHLGELWSLFEFLNPGMLGSSTAFERLTKSRSEEDRAAAIPVLSRAIQPFLLRRTKEQVLTELPGKTEQVLFCEMPTRQKKLYNELRDYYRVQLSSRIDQMGMNRARIHVLEALLRLRQVACHPGLVDEKHLRDSSAKLDLLLDQLTQVVEDGHKALVFSQFTSLLDIVRNRLTKSKVRFAYLDGKTSNRQKVVTDFQDDPKCPLFLISLKAGGHGLNLTAADYVFILDPWWNPAVEAQAVDRAHRIGQKRHVFAYRLICKDTVEERILELQKQKQELAEAIVCENSSIISNLTAEDLTLLLS